MENPSLAVQIDETTQDITIAFTPQHLQPQQYGVVIAAVVLHVANCFQETNQGADKARIIEAILDGIKYGLEHQRVSEPSTQH